MSGEQLDNKRIAWWDNVKFIMILCVVIGHTLYEFIGKDTRTAKSIYLFIYTFHMPVFIFLTGMFAKKAIVRKRYDRVIEYLFIYLIMKFLDFLARCLTSHTKKKDFMTLRYLKEIKEGLLSPNRSFHLFWEDGPAWFALAIAVFILITIYIQDIDKRIVLTSTILLGCLAGLDNHLGDHFVSLRICTFYPVFLLCYYTNRICFEQKEFRKGWKKVIFSRIPAAALLALVLCICILFGETWYSRINFLKGKRDYMSLGLGINGVIYRALCYGLWIVMILAIIYVCPRRKYIFSWIGTRTMSVFIWHKFILMIILQLFYGKYYIKHEVPHFYIIVALCLAVIVTVVTSYLPDFRISGWTDKDQIKAKIETGEISGTRES